MSHSSLRDNTDGGDAPKASFPSVFRVESREGGVYDSKVKAKARKDPAAFLRALMELGDESSGTYCRATLPTRGADLTIGPDGFEILEPSKGSTKEGTFTCSA